MEKVCTEQKIIIKKSGEVEISKTKKSIYNLWKTREKRKARQQQTTHPSSTCVVRGGKGYGDTFNDIMKGHVLPLKKISVSANQNTWMFFIRKQAHVLHALKVY
jgi:hypothetical protein